MTLPAVPRISVIVISRNEGAWLGRTLENLLDTIPGGSEILVVDDGSEDGSADYLQGQRSGPKLLRTPGLGVARARNYGGRRAKGDVLVFADAHLELPAGWWRPLVALLRLPKAGAAAPAVASMEAPDKFGHGYTVPSPDLVPRWMPTRTSGEPVQAPILPGCCLAMTRTTFVQTGGFDRGLKTRGGIDAETGMRFWLLGLENWVAPESKILHLFRSSAPYEVSRAEVLHNRLRFALVHLNSARVSKVKEALSCDPSFPRALRLIEKSGVNSRTIDIRGRRIHDDSWCFDKFCIGW